MTRQPIPIRPLRYETWIIAHRGDRAVAPENTLEAFEEAIRAKADMVEFDVTLTKDDVPVVIHDVTLARTTGLRKRVRSVDYQDIRRLDAGSWFSKKFKSARIPTLDEVLDLARGRIAVNIEIKKEAVSSGSQRIVEREILRTLTRTKMAAHSVISSFEPKVLRHLRKMNPRVSLALLLSKPLPPNGKLTAKASGYDALHLPVAELGARTIKSLHMRKIPFRVYTVNRTADMNRLLQWRTNGIFTDRVRELVRLLEDWPSKVYKHE